LIEALVALLIFSIVAAGLAETLVAAQTTRHTSALRMEANQLAVAEAERARAGEPTVGTITIGVFSSATSVEALPAYPDLARVRVTVDWMDRTPQRLELVTLLSSRSDDE
jgi:type II secretory pathway pseudopilin PulG